MPPASEMPPARRRKRLLIAGIVVAVLGAGVGGLVLVRQYRLAQHMEGLREQGLAALEAGRYEEALHKTGSYLNYAGRGEPEPLFAYARAREEVEDKRNEHLNQAVAFYRQYLQDFPAGDRVDEARTRLARLYGLMGANAELLDLTADAESEARPFLDGADPADGEAAGRALERLHLRATALAATGELADAYRLVDAFLEVRPLDVDATIFAIQLSANLGDELDAPAPEARVAELAERFGDDPRVGLIDAFVKLASGDDEAGRQALLASARGLGRPSSGPVEPRALRRTMLMLDALGEFEAGTRLLTRLAGSVGAGGDDLGFRRLAANRLLRAGAWPGLIDLTDGVEPRYEGELAGLRGLALVEAGKRDEAIALADELEARPEETIARAWAPVVRAWQPTPARLVPGVAPVGPRAETAERFAAAEVARAVYDHPAFRLMLAEALLDAGEPVPAAELASSTLSPGAGSGPWLRGMSTFAQAAVASRDVQRTNATLAAIRRSFPGDPDAEGVVGVTLALAGNTQEAGRLLSETGRAPAESLAGLLGVVLAPDADDVPAPDDLAEALTPTELLATLAIAQRVGSPAAPAIVAALRASGDAGADELAVAGRLRGEPVDVAASLSPAVRIAVADPSAAQEVAEELASDAEASVEPAAVNRVLEARVFDVAEADAWRLLRRLTSSAAEAVEPHGAAWPVRLARLDLSRPDAPAEDAILREHATRLGRVAREHPGFTPAQQALVDVLDRLGSPETATEQLELAVAASPEDASLRLQLVERLVRAGGTPEGHLSELEARADRLVPEARNRLATLLVALGEDARALAVLPDEAGGADRLRLEARAGRIDRGRLASAAASDDPATAAVAAELLAAAGEFDAALSAIDRLAGLGVAEAEVARRRASILLAADRPEEAIDVLREAIASLPKDRRLRRSLVLAELSRRDPEAAATAAERAAEALDAPAAEVFASFVGTLRSAGDLLVAGPAQPMLNDVRQLSAAAIDAVEAEEAGRLLGFIDAIVGLLRDEADEATTREVARQLREFAASRPDLSAATRLSVRLDLAAGEAQEAVVSTSRLVNLDRRDPVAAQLRVDALAAADQPEAAREAAAEWRRRLELAGAPREQLLLADLAAARLEAALGRPARAIALVEPYLTPDASPALRAFVADARLQNDDARGAVRVLGGDNPPAARDPLFGRWVAAATRAAAEGDDVATRGLRRASDRSANDPDVELAQLLGLGRAMAIPISVSPDAEELGEAMGEVIDRVEVLLADADDGPSDGEANATLASRYEQAGLLASVSGRPEQAEALYRRAIALDARRPISRNNLAMILVGGAGGDEAVPAARLDEARSLIAPLLEDEVVAESPAFAAILDTRATIAAAAGDASEAIHYIDRAIRHQPDEPEWLVHRAELSVEAGDVTSARQSLRAARRLMSQGPTQMALRERADAVEAALADRRR